MPPQRHPKKRRTGRKLFAFFVAIGILGFGWVHIVHGSSKTAHHRTSVCSAHAGHHARTCSQPAKVTKKVTASSALRIYAVHLLPQLSRARSVFDGATAAMQQTDYGTLDSVCGTYGSQITIAAEEVDGVPHPGPWYQAVSQLHHGLLGLFHDMLGALQMCQTASENADDWSLGVARNDAVVADEQLRSSDDYAISLAHHR